MKVGDIFLWKGDQARIMAIAEGYIMARKKGCYPFLEPIKEVEAAQQNAQADAGICTACGEAREYHVGGIGGLCKNPQHR